MRPHEFANFELACAQAKLQLLCKSKIVHSDHWQGMDIRSKPEMATHEVKHISFQVPMGGYEFDLEAYANHIGPNLPWADDHFEERVCGEPINPGIQWAKWPYGHSAARFLDERGQFNHNYMERYWPKRARHVKTATDTAEEFRDRIRRLDEDVMRPWTPNRGIEYEYGDLNDVLNLLANDPYTRQAYLPVWFPEDTGGGSKRAPCTLGYHFLMREDKLDIDYHIRSCDFIRHFRDDIYLTVRLALWMIERCREVNPEWNKVKPGQFIMHIGSLHCFRNDYPSLRS